MKVDSFNIEFGYELLSAVPYAWELHQQGKLTGTRSGYDTDALYYFSPNHEINMGERSWYNTERARRAGLPYTSIHHPELQPTLFPPYKEHYANKKYRFKKPTVCICNRYNKEWNSRAINFFSPELLDWMFSVLKEKYEIVYFPVNIPEELRDNEQPMAMDDISVAKRHGVKVFTEMIEGLSWNETMLRVFANCERYITMNGGYSIMASFFCGVNIIYSKPGEPETREIKLHSFERWYPNIADSQTVYVASYEALKAKITALYIEEKPCLNILIRTHRPNYLAKCLKSVSEQEYPNINVVLICDSDKAVAYTRQYPYRMVRVHKTLPDATRPDGEDHGVYFPYNRYLGEVQKKVKGYIMFLDDDDMMYSGAIESIMENVSRDSLLLWRVSFNGRGLIPSDATFGKEIKVCDITGIGYCYHSDHTKHTDWSEWKRADYRTARNLSKVLKVKWLDEVLTSIQDTPGWGVKKDITTMAHVRFTYPDGRKVEQYFSNEEFAQYEPIYKQQGICIEQLT
jgi:hypothetical protein